MDNVKPAKTSKRKEKPIINPLRECSSTVLGFWPDSKAVMLREDKSICLRDLESNEKLREFNGNENTVYCAAATTNKNYLFAGGIDTSLWHCETDQIVWRREYYLDNRFVPVERVTISANNRRALLEYHGRVDTFDFDGRSIDRTFENLIPHWSRAISPDGQYMLTGGNGKQMILWDLDDGSEIHRFTGHTGLRIHTVAFTDDGRHALSCSGNDKTVRIWDLNSREEIRCVKFSKKTNSENTGAFSNDGRRFLSRTFDDNAVLLWDLENDQELARLPHAHFVTRVGLSPDGNYAFSIDNNGSSFLWRLQ